MLHINTKHQRVNRSHLILTRNSRLCCPYLFAFFVAHLFSGITSAQNLVTNGRLVIGAEKNLSASVRLGDLDGDGDLDAVIANGRHWPQQNYLAFNQGRSNFSSIRPLGIDRSTTYACELADLDGDGDLDIATGNDRAPNRIFLNDGKGNFQLHAKYGSISSLRSLTLADIDSDGDHDILTTCRGAENQIFLNDGSANFTAGGNFGSGNDSTIDVAVGDVNGDGRMDIALANRDKQPNAWLLNEGDLKFSKPMTFGDNDSQSRAVATGDFDGDGKLDWAVGNIGQQNVLFLGDGSGAARTAIKFGDKDSRTFCLSASDIDSDGNLDIIAGNNQQSNSVFINNGDATSFRKQSFGSDNNATYGLSVGDLNGDGQPDVVIANSDEANRVFLNRSTTRKKSRQTSTRQKTLASRQLSEKQPVEANGNGPVTDAATDWTTFRGNDGRGVAEGFTLPTKWNADASKGDLENVLWQMEVPGLGHSSPVIAGKRLFLLTAVASDGKAPLTVKSGGKPTAADDNGTQEWLLLCYDKNTGKELWRRTAIKRKPLATRHAKATHANTSVCVEGNKVVAFLGSEGLYCFDLEGELLWSRDLGVIDISKYGIGWGFASSPAVHKDRIAIICDDPKDPYVAALSLEDGKELWRKSRKGICERNWSTPLIHEQDGVTQMVVNGWPWLVSYDMANGEELWRIKGGGDNPVPTPFVSDGFIYITSAHGGPSPIYVVHPSARGDLSEIVSSAAQSSESPDSKTIRWSVAKGGSYMSTPVSYRDHLYFGNSNGIIRCFHAQTGEKLFQGRPGRGAGVIASLVAGDGKIYCASENGTLYVLEHGNALKIVAENPMGDPCLASPALSEGVLFVRTTTRLIAVKQ